MSLIVPLVYFQFSSLALNFEALDDDDDTCVYISGSFWNAAAVQQENPWHSCRSKCCRIVATALRAFVTNKASQLCYISLL